ncbi:hypothetical protein F4604DRAFT_1930231 [Suillus subluteus]|nr:hypothetical protein F4604DRAFT_1930231 [Suillus subluteus]
MAQLLPTASAVYGKVDKKNFSVIHPMGFSNFLLKPELLPVRAISDLSFWHPSEVQQECIPQMEWTSSAKQSLEMKLEPVNGEVSIIVLYHTCKLTFKIKND